MPHQHNNTKDGMVEGRSSIFSSLIGLLAPAVLLCLNSPAHSQGMSREKKRFSEEAPVKWREYQAFSRRLHGTASATIVDTDTGSTTREHSVRIYIKQSNVGAIHHEIREEKKRVKKEDYEYQRGEQVRLSNSKYSARLSKRDVSKGWLLDKLVFEANVPLSSDKTPAQEAYERVSPHFSFANYSLIDVCKDPHFKMKRVFADRRDERELVRVDFQWRRKRGHNVTDYDGTMLLDPGQYWHVVEFDARYGEGIGRVKGSSETVLVMGSYPVIKTYSFVNESKPPNGKVFVHRGTTEFELRDSGDLPENEFTLTAFGLPEPVGVTFEQPTRWHLWFGVGAVACFAAGIACYRLARRAGAKQASPGAGKA
jgi:hypothetical protein